MEPEDVNVWKIGLICPCSYRELTDPYLRFSYLGNYPNGLSEDGLKVVHRALNFKKKSQKKVAYSVDGEPLTKDQVVAQLEQAG